MSNKKYDLQDEVLMTAAEASMNNLNTKDQKQRYLKFLIKIGIAC